MLITEIENFENKCTGCGACVCACPKDAISMVKNAEGFLYPEINTSDCIHCGKCAGVCQIQKELPCNVNLMERELYSCFSTDADIRAKGSSGGLALEIELEFVHSGGIVVVSMMDNDLKARHYIVDNEDDVLRSAGSKYIQSDTNSTYSCIQELLQRGEKVLFTGTPCQVRGLYVYLGKEYEKLYTLDFVCHGVPTSTTYEDMCRHIEEQHHSQIMKVTFRDKTNGWRIQTTKFYLANGQLVNEYSKNTLHYQAFVNSLSLRRSCYGCDSAGAHSSDITVGDYWLTDDKDDKGVSQACCHTEKGKQLFQSVTLQISVSVITDKEKVRACYMPHDEKMRYIKQEREKFFADYSQNGYIATQNAVCKAISKKQKKERLKSFPRRCVSKVIRLIRGE